jgi:hypothetical protein
MFVELPAGVGERIIDRCVGVFVLASDVGTSCDDELGTGNRQVDAYAIVAPVLFVAVRSLDRHATRNDVRRECLKLLCPLSNVRVDGVCALKVAVRDLHGKGHRGTSSKPKWCALATVLRNGKNTLRSGRDTLPRMRPRSASLSWLAPSLLAPCLLALAIVVPTIAHAQRPPPPAERGLVYSLYEEQTIAEVLDSLGQERDPAPEGKEVERVDIAPLDVIEQRDPLPLWVNVFHFTSRTPVIRRELLVREGEPYRQVLVDETIRNLRRLPQLSVILVVATKGSTADRIGIVVITKDVWSLRLNWNVALTPGGVELFEAQPAEWNFLGTHQTLSGIFVFEPSSYTFGLGYVAPRLGTSRVAVQASADVIVNRSSGDTEGSLGSAIAGQPLYSALTEWAWDASVAWRDQPLRRYVNAQLSLYRDAATGQSLPFEYRERQYLTTYELTRSFGWDVKHDVTLAAGIDRQQYRVDFPGVDQRTRDDFAAANVPVSDTRVGPSIQYHGYTKRYLRVIDFDTLALQEDHRLGRDVVLRVYPSFRALGSTRDVIGLYTALQYTFAVRDGLFRVSFQTRTERDTDQISDAAIEPTAHFASPTVAGLGRIVLDATMVYRWRNYLNKTTYIGGDDRLRGYPTNFFVGPDVVAYNVEIRSRPVEILTCQLAGVAFFDSGDAFRGFDHFQPYQSVGVGLRALFPQLDRVVFRADIGFPLERPLDATGTPIAPLGFHISFDQAFSTPTVSPSPVLPTGQ